MVLLKEVLRRWLGGGAKKTIAGDLGLDPRTVRRYVSLAQEAGAGKPDAARPVPPSSEAVDALVEAVVRRRAVDRHRPHGGDWALCVEHREKIAALLRQRHVGRRLRLTKIRKLLERDERVAVTYPTLRRFVLAELGDLWGQTTTIPVADGPPGGEIQVDTGWVGELCAPDGTRRRFKAWIFTPVLSRYRFVHPCHRETTASAIEACEAAWAFYGGVFHVLVPDNTKAIVAQADPLEPIYARDFLEYAQARDFVIDPTRVRRPRDKPRVEKSVAVVRDDCYGGERLGTLEAARGLGERWSRDVYGLRPHRTTGRRPREHFDAVERTALKPAPNEPYDLPEWSHAKVQPDQYARVGDALYSLPRHLVGKKLETRADRRTVRLYLRGELVRAHATAAPGEHRVTERSDFAPERLAYAERDADFFLKDAEAAGEAIGRYAHELAADQRPWTRLRLLGALRGLVRRYGAERVEPACREALAHDLVSVKRLERQILAARAPTTAAAAAVKPLPPGRFLKPTGTYALRRPSTTATTTATKEENSV